MSSRSPQRAGPEADQPSIGPLALEALDRRRRRDAALVLPIVGLVLFASPLLDIVAGWGSVMGLPAVVLYVFVAWFCLIALTVCLAGPLARDDAGAEDRGG